MKKIVICGSVFVVLIAVIIWACTSCSEKKAEEKFSDEGMEVVEVWDENSDDETEEDKENATSDNNKTNSEQTKGSDESKQADLKEDTVTAPEDWGDDESDDANQNEELVIGQPQDKNTSNDTKEENNTDAETNTDVENDANVEKNSDEDTTGGYGKLF